MEGVQKVRELEQLILADAKNANFLLVIKKQLQNDDISKEERTAALHSLRRIFVNFLENGRLEASFVSAHSNQLSLSADAGKLLEYKKWLIEQFNSYQRILRQLIASNDESLQAPAIRTMLEFVKREHMVSKSRTVAVKSQIAGDKSDSHSWFGVRTCQSLLETILSMDDIDIDILVLLRDEMFCKPDCAFYALVIIRNLLHESRASNKIKSAEPPAIAASVILVKNCLDMLRFITLPDDDEVLTSRKAFLVRGKGSSGDGTHFDDDDSSGDEEEDNDGAEVLRAKSNGKKGGGMKRTIVPAESSSKRQKKMTRSEQLVHLPSHKKVFSKAWLALLAMPLTNAQHKIVLKHLPENVIGNLTQPLLLADYMTQSYEQGGVVAVLALESLFQLIVKHNLDYPNFFASLYRLCNYDVLSAKYRAKFMKLLTMCLRSANMPGYLVAAFAKRLSQLSLRVPSPSALFCVAQVTWLLRQHPQCMVLVHKHSTDKSNEAERREFDALEEHDLEKCDALHSSLWEIETLSSHCLHTVSTFAKALQGAPSTSVGMDAPSLIVEDFIEHTYASLMDTEGSSGKKKNEKNTALAFKEPIQLLPPGSIMRQCFGSI